MKTGEGKTLVATLPVYLNALTGRFGRRCDYLAQAICSKPYLMGERFSVADAYLFTILGWANMFKLDLDTWPTLKDYMARIATRPAVKEAMRAEGLTK